MPKISLLICLEIVGRQSSNYLLPQVKVPDRTAVTTANAETQVVKPSGLQELINAEIGKQLCYFQAIFVYPLASLFDLFHLSFLLKTTI